MQNMVEVWDTVSFYYHPYRDTGVSILSSVDEIQTMLDDQIVKTQTMRGSPFIKPFETEIKVRLRLTDGHFMKQVISYSRIKISFIHKCEPISRTVSK